MNNDLKKIFQIQEVLKETGYSDYQRIANEVLDFHNKSNTPLEDIFADLRKDIPWEYICGYAEFDGKFFKVTTETLIPRVETEELVQRAREILHSSSTPFKTALDVGTGSGCIAISIAEDVKDARLIATDIREETLNIAIENAKNNEVKNIDFIHTDLIEGVEIEEPVLILANLPYIPTQQYEELDPCVINNEPRIALDGGRSGLDLYQKLFDQLNSKGITRATILVELEPSTLRKFLTITEESFKHLDPKIEIIKDYRDLERFVLINLS